MSAGPDPRPHGGPHNGPVWLTPVEAASRVRRHRDVLRKALTSGELHGHRRGERGHWRVHVDALDAWVLADALCAERDSYRACPCSTSTARPLRRGA